MGWVDPPDLLSELFLGVMSLYLWCTKALTLITEGESTSPGLRKLPLFVDRYKVNDQSSCRTWMRAHCPQLANGPPGVADFILIFFRRVRSSPTPTVVHTQIFMHTHIECTPKKFSRLRRPRSFFQLVVSPLFKIHTRHIWTFTWDTTSIKHMKYSFA